MVGRDASLLPPWWWSRGDGWTATAAAAAATFAAVAAGALFLSLCGPILRPTVIAFPWPPPAEEEGRRRRAGGGAADKAKTVVLAGSFNPPHKGHLAMLVYLAERCVAWMADSSSRRRFARLVIALLYVYFLTPRSLVSIKLFQLRGSDRRGGLESQQEIPRHPGRARGAHPAHARAPRRAFQERSCRRCVCHLLDVRGGRCN